MKRITIKEIAKRAGVSIGTVDRVIHNRGEVAQKTRELVLKIAREGNYEANVYARSLKLNRTFTVAVLLPMDNEYWREHNRGIMDSIRQYMSLGLQLQHFTFDRQDPDSFSENANRLIEAHPSGVILAPIIEDKTLEITQKLDAAGIPYIFVDSDLLKANPLSFIGQDSKRAGYLAAKLLNFGHIRGHKAFIVKFKGFDSMNKTIGERISGFKEYYRDEQFQEGLIQEIDYTDLRNKLETESGDAWIHLFIPNSRAFEMDILLMNKSLHTRCVGFDLISENKDSIRNGYTDFIIDQNPYQQGELAVQVFYKKLILDGKAEPRINIPLEIITRENLSA